MPRCREPQGSRAHRCEHKKTRFIYEPSAFVLVRKKGLERISAPGNADKKEVAAPTTSGVPEGVPKKTASPLQFPCNSSK